MHEVLIHLTGLLMPIGIGVALALALRQGRTVRGLRAEVAAASARHARLEQDFEALLACSRNLGDQLREQRETQQSILEQMRSLESQSDGALAVAHAAKLIDTGAELAEVSRICDLTRGEVELLSRLSKRRRAA